MWNFLIMKVFLAKKCLSDFSQTLNFCFLFQFNYLLFGSLNQRFFGEMFHLLILLQSLRFPFWILARRSKSWIRKSWWLFDLQIILALSLKIFLWRHWSLLVRWFNYMTTLNQIERKCWVRFPLIPSFFSFVLRIMFFLWAWWVKKYFKYYIIVSKSY